MIVETDNQARSNRSVNPAAAPTLMSPGATTRSALPVVRPRAHSTKRFISHTRILLIALTALAVTGRLLSPTFFSRPNLQNIMLNVSILGMLALGMTVVMLLREIDLSVGSLMAFAPIVAVTVTDFLHRSSETPVITGGNIVGHGTALIMTFTLLISVLVGLVIGLITVRGPVPSVIVTLGALFALRGGSYVVSGGNQFYMTDLTQFMWLGTATVFDFVPVSFVIFFSLGTLGALSLLLTKAGRRIYAIGGNERAAVYSGIRAGRWKILAFVICGLCAGVAALFFSSRLGSAESGQASGFELSAIAIAVVGGVTLEGGRGSLVNTMLASVLLAVVMNIIALEGLIVWYQTVIVGLIIIAAGFTYTVQDRASRAP